VNYNGLGAGFKTQFIHKRPPANIFCYFAQQTILNLCPVLTKAK